MKNRLNKNLEEIKSSVDNVFKCLECYEIDGDVHEQEFNDYLDETYGQITIDDCTFGASRILKELDDSYDAKCQSFAEQTKDIKNESSYQLLIDEVNEYIRDMERIIDAIDINIEFGTGEDGIEEIKEDIKQLITDYQERLEEYN